MNELKSVLKRLNEEVKLSSEKVELASIAEVEKMKDSFLKEWKKHTSLRDKWGARANEVLKFIGEVEREGEKLKKDADGFDSELMKIVNKVEELKKAAKELGLELPSKYDNLDGVSFGAWGNKFVDTREIVDDFSKNK